MMPETHTLVVGGGPSGLAVAYALGGDTVILEKAAAVGGLCRSIHFRGGVFDIGGHSFHTPHPEVFDLVQRLLDGGLYLQKRDARVHTHGTLIPYPFQKSYDRIPDPEVVRACEEGLRAAQRPGPPPADFEEYIVARFGRGIADHFMLPYNRKLWARDLKRISCDWTTERVAAPKDDTERFEWNTGVRRPLQADTEVGYPRSGGFEEIYRAFVPHVPRVELGSEVIGIDAAARTAHTRDGRAFRWRCLVSTMPIPVLLRMIDGAPDEVVALGDRLDFLSLRVELLLTREPLAAPVQRIYSADASVQAHKIALNHNSSEHLRSRPRHAIMAEVSHSPDKPIDTATIAPRTIEFLCDLGVLPGPDAVEWTGHVDVRYAYPVYTHDRADVVARVKAWLERRDIYTLGRFGEWEYINSDRCIMKGLTLGRLLRERYPDRAYAAP